MSHQSASYKLSAQNGSAGQESALQGNQGGSGEKTGLLGRAQRSRAGLSTAYSLQRSVSKNGQIEAMKASGLQQQLVSNANMTPSQAGAHATNQHSPHAGKPSTETSGISASGGTSGLTQTPERVPQQSHWQKVTSNNHELTKLFYQLPGGTKTLVQNAIPSHNGLNKAKNNPSHRYLGASGKKPGRKHSYIEKKAATSGTPVPANSDKYSHLNNSLQQNLMQSAQPYKNMPIHSKAELPGI